MELLELIPVGNIFLFIIFFTFIVIFFCGARFFTNCCFVLRQERGFREFGVTKLFSTFCIFSSQGLLLVPNPASYRTIGNFQPSFSVSAPIIRAKSSSPHLPSKKSFALNYQSKKLLALIFSLKHFGHNYWSKKLFAPS